MLRNKMTTETLDKLYLEWSQFTEARTSRETDLLDLATNMAGLDDAILRTANLAVLRQTIRELREDARRLCR